MTSSPSSRPWLRKFARLLGLDARPCRRHGTRLLLEVLEDRLAPAILTVNTTADNVYHKNDVPADYPLPDYPYLTLRVAIHVVNDPSLVSLLSDAQKAQIIGDLDETKNTIKFNIPGAGVQTIQVGSDPDPRVAGAPLPTIMRPVIIDGYSQPGSKPNDAPDDDNAILLIELKGRGDYPAVNGDGLVIAGGNSTVRGLVINGFLNYSGIVLQGAAGNRVQGNFIGTDVSGTLAPYGLPDFSTVFVSTSDLHIGVQVNESYGFQHNYIGTDSRTDPTDPPGWSDLAERNVLSAAAAGVAFNGPGLTSPDSFNWVGDVSQYPSAQTNNVVAGNFIGTDAHGTTALGNWVGVTWLVGAHDDLIGTDGNGINDTGERNIISGNKAGIAGGGGTTLASYRSAVAGNFIGADVNGGPMGNLSGGVGEIIGSLSDRIGGPSAVEGNTIAYNGDYNGSYASNGTYPYSLRYDIASHGTPSSNAPGVWIYRLGNRATPLNITVQGNSIHDNAGLGIDLGGTYPSPGPDGKTDNDLGDGDSGPNQLQNYPALTGATAGATTAVSGSLNSVAGVAYTLDFYANAVADPSSHGEGERYLGHAQVTTDGSGNATFIVYLPTATTPGEWLTATATAPDGSTSEFSLAFQVTETADLPAVGSGTAVTLTPSGDTSLINVAAVSNPSPADAPAGVVFPLGYFTFTVQGVAQGGTTTVTLTLPPGVSVNTYYQYGPTPDNLTPHWYKFLYDGTTGAVIDNAAHTITLHFKDGERGDHDLLANRVIVDPGAPAFLPPGRLDPTFGAGGVITTDGLLTTTEVVRDVAVLPDARILVAAQVGDFGSDFELLRYNPDGTPDVTFGSGGRVRTNFGATDRPQKVLVLPDGKVLVVGFSDDGRRNTGVLVRYNPDGSLDPTFGDGGVTRDFGLRLWDAAVQPDGKVVAIAYGSVVARYHPDGTPDLEFGFGGRTTVSVAGRAIAVQPDGRIVVAGEAFISANNSFDFAFARLNPDGSLDSTFDGDGSTTVTFAGAGVSEGVEDVDVLPDGRIVAVGTEGVGSTGALVRLNPDGSSDASFDEDGHVTASFPGARFGLASRLAVQANGRVVVAGASGVAVARYNTDGSPDTTFGAGGLVTIDLGSGWSQGYGNAVAVQPDGAIVLAGEAMPPGVLVKDVLGLDVVVARVFGDPVVGVSAPDLAAADDTGRSNTDNITQKTTVTLSGTADPGTTVRLWSGPTLLGTAAGGAWSITVTLPEGRHTVYATATTAGGDVGYSSGLGLVIDTTAPDLTLAASAPTAVPGELVRFTRTVVETNAGIDPATLLFQVDGQSVTGAMVEVTATVVGDLIARLAAADLAGNFAEVTRTVIVNRAEMRGGDLYVGGTTGSDDLSFTPGQQTGAVDVFLNGVSVGTYAPTGRIVAYAGAGDDNVQVAGSIGLSAWLYGGEGNDRLKGGKGANVLEGGDGDDLLVGGSGRDLMIGGDGADRMIGNGGDDILIGGTTSYDGNEAALVAIMAEWTSSNDFATRQANLTNTGSGLLSRLNGNYFLLDSGSRQTVFNDSSSDMLTGSAGSDWFFADTADKVTDLSATDQAFIFGP